METIKAPPELLNFALLTNFFLQEFDDYRDADDAVYELNGRDLLGSRVVVEHARGPRRDNRGGGGDRRDR